jgi:hypothetical protein
MDGDSALRMGGFELAHDAEWEQARKTLHPRSLPVADLQRRYSPPSLEIQLQGKLDLPCGCGSVRPGQGLRG